MVFKRNRQNKTNKKNRKNRRNKTGGKRRHLRNTKKNRTNRRNKSLRKNQRGGRRNRNKNSRKQRRQRRYQYGGNNPALVGKQWNAVDGGNYHPLYDTRGITPQAGMHPNDRFHPVHQGQKGGNLIPRDLLNLGRSVGKGFYDIYAGYRGVPPAKSPLPSKDHGIDVRTKYIGGLPVDVSKRLTQADRIVANI